MLHRAGRANPATRGGRAVEKVVPFEAYCATSNDPLSGLLTHVVHDGVMGEKEQRTYLEDVFSKKTWTSNAGWYGTGFQ